MSFDIEKSRLLLSKVCATEDRLFEVIEKGMGFSGKDIMCQHELIAEMKPGKDGEDWEDTLSYLEKNDHIKLLRSSHDVLEARYYKANSSGCSLFGKERLI